MARKATKRRLPKLGRHSSGQARCTIAGKVYYCGAFGTAEALRRYSELIERWEAGGRQPLDPTPDVEQAKPLKAVFQLWLDQLDASGRYVKRGAPTSARRRLHSTIDAFLTDHGAVPAHRYSERLLLLFRDRLERDPDLTRAGINRKVAMVRTGLRWSYERGHIGRDAWLATAALAPLSRAAAGHRDIRKAKRAPTPAEIEQVASVASPTLAAMIRVQFATGMRPGELCSMRWSDIDRAPVQGCWTYRVAAENAKTAHHGGSIRYAIVPSVQPIVDAQPMRSPSSPVFSTTAPGLNGPRSSRGWSVGGYRAALLAACERAGVAPFTGHEVRHGSVTLACARFGTFAASALANHTRLATTEGYAHRDDSDRYRVALGLAGGAS